MDKHTNDDLDMIQNPGKWPIRGLLPLKRRSDKIGGFPELAVLVNDNPPPFTVLKCNMHEIPKMTEAQLNQKTLRYDSAQAILDEWVVD